MLACPTPTVYSMQMRANLSSEIEAVVRDRVLDGALAPGERVNEVHLSEELRVSRTPLREALTRLASDGLLQSRPRRGFFVPELTVEEVQELYPLRGLLDPEALRLAGVPTPPELDELERLNAAIGEAQGDPVRVIDLDDRWHRRLIEPCGNSVLLGIIDQIIVRSRRYELAYLRERAHVENAVGEHEAILDALRRDDLDEACAALRQNMSSAREPLLEWLRSRPSTAMKDKPA